MFERRIISSNTILTTNDRIIDNIIEASHRALNPRALEILRSTKLTPELLEEVSPEIIGELQVKFAGQWKHANELKQKPDITIDYSQNYPHMNPIIFRTLIGEQEFTIIAILPILLESREHDGQIESLGEIDVYLRSPHTTDEKKAALKKLRIQIIEDLKEQIIQDISSGSGLVIQN